jgi:hypothetical protein
MRFRLRTLLTIFTITAVGCGIAAWIIRAQRPVSIFDSAVGKQALHQLSSSKVVEVEWQVMPAYKRELSKDEQRQLLEWLEKATGDNTGMERILLGRIRFSPKGAGDWGLLQIDDREISVQTPSGTWRGLDRAEFDRIISRARAPAND